MRNLYNVLPNGMLWIGDPRVGRPSADIPVVSLLKQAAADHPGQLLRFYVTENLSRITFFYEDGSYDGVFDGPVTGALYINGAYTETLVLQPVVIDITSPILSSPQVSGVSAHGCIPSVITDESNGTLYVVVVPDADAPSDAQIKSGKQSSGANAIAARSVSVGHVGKHFLNAITNLSPSTSYEVYFLHSDSSGNDSDSVTVGFTTNANISGGTAIRYNAPINRFFRRR